MAVELGIGIRVRLGWTHDDSQRFSLQTGTITDGRFRAEYPHLFSDGIVHVCDDPTWEVLLDSGTNLMCSERYIFPIDDGNDQTTRDEREPVEETC